MTAIQQEKLRLAQWAFKKSDIILSNPPIYCAMDEKAFKLECGNLYDFLLAMASFQAGSWGLPFSSEDIYYLNEENLSRIAAEYGKRSYALHQWIDISFYGNHGDEVICVLGGEQIAALKKEKDDGPIQVVSGSAHTKMPSIKSVKEGDVIYPVIISGGTLCVGRGESIKLPVMVCDENTTLGYISYDAMI